MKIHLAGNNPYPGIILIRLYESWIGERLGKFGGETSAFTSAVISFFRLISGV